MMISLIAIPGFLWNLKVKNIHYESIDVPSDRINCKYITFHTSLFDILAVPQSRKLFFTVNKTFSGFKPGFSIYHYILFVR